VEQIRTIRPPLVTCEAVLAELCFLLSDVPKGITSVRDNLACGAWAMDFSLKDEQERVFAMMGVYSDQPMSLADGCLVRMSELRADSRIFTLDRHFRVYRRNRRQVIPLITPLAA
jgi:predicted nucleic acid-binding protein